MDERDFENPRMTHEDARKLLFQVQEFITTEVSFISKMTQLETAIHNKSRENKLSNADELLCQNSQKNCQNITTSKNIFINELTGLLEDVTRFLENSSPRSVISVDNDETLKNAKFAVQTLVSLYKQKSYQDYCQTIIDSVLNFSKLSSVMQDDKLGIGSLLINATQRIPRHGLFFESLSKKCKTTDVLDALHLSEKNGRTLNKIVSLGAIEQAISGQATHTKKEIGLELILKLHLNSFSSNEEAIRQYSNDFIQSTLIQAYPHKFTIRDSQFISLGKDQPEIDMALGLPNAILDPQQFDAKLLDELWIKTKKPLWRVLKSTKPIDDSFPVTQKLLAYQQIIDSIQQGLLGKKNKAALIWKEAENLIRVANNHPTDEFSSELLQILVTLNRQLESLSSPTLFERFQKFVPLFRPETAPSPLQQQILSELHHLIAHQEEKRTLIHILAVRKKPNLTLDPLNEQKIFKSLKKPNQKKTRTVTPAPIFISDKKPKDALKIDDIDIDVDTDDNSSPHE